MLKTQVTPWRVLFGLSLIITVATVPVQAGDLATMQFGGTFVSWEPVVRYDQAVLTISGPSGVVTQTFTADQVPFIDLATFEGPVDGSYTFELRLTPLLQPGVRQMLEAAREQGDALAERQLREQGLLPPEPLVQSGYLVAQGGQFIVPGGEEEPVGALQPRNAGESGLASAGAGVEDLRNVSAADQVILDDLIVDGSACIGQDCVNGESFGFDTIRIKENNTRIKFDDTSNSASFPNFDWQLTANDSTNGGANKFSIEDITSGRIPFTLEGSAPSNSLYVDDGGRIGLGTSTPVVELHVKDGDTPTLRLEQDGSSGFQSQTWDVAGNETNYFVRDVSNGSKLPFKIRPNADTNSLVLEANGDVTMNGGNLGIGTTTPSELIHILGTDNPQVLIEDTTDNTNDKPGFILRSPAALNGGDWVFEVDNTGAFQIDYTLSTGPEIRFTDTDTTNSAVTIAGDLTVQGTFSNPSSRTLKTAIEAVDRGEILRRLVELPINEWTYTSDIRGLRHIGPFTEDFRKAFGLGTLDKNIIPLDVQGVTIAAVQGLYDTVSLLKTENARLQQRLAETETLKDRVAELEALIKSLVTGN